MSEHETRKGAGGLPVDGLLESVRARAEGRLSTEAEAELLLRTSSHPEDAELAAAYQEVHAVTAVLESDPPPCRVRFEDVEERIAARPGRLLRSVWGRAAAAAFLGAVGIAGWALTTPTEPMTVNLHAVRMSDATVVDGAEETGDPLAAAALAAAGPLADYQPLRDGEPEWLGSLEQGRAVARATGRPVLLFIHHPTCPACLDLRGETFQSADVQARLAEFVPVMVNVMELPESLQPFLGRGWPYLGALNADGDELTAFPGYAEAAPFVERLDEALEVCGARRPLPWGRARALAARLRDAMAAGDAADLPREYRELVALRDDDADGAFGRGAASRLAWRGADVADALRRAAESPENAEAVLEAAAERYRGTPWGDDIDRVREALRETGRFPRLRSPPEKKL